MCNNFDSLALICNQRFANGGFKIHKFGKNLSYLGANFHQNQSNLYLHRSNCLNFCFIG